MTGPTRPVTVGSDEHLLDNRGVPCALGLIRLRQTMETMVDGQVVVVLSRDRFAPIEIPLWAERVGHTLLATDRAGAWPRRTHWFRLRKAPTAVPVNAVDL